MSTRRNLYVVGFVAASLAYIFVSLAYTGAFHLFRWVTFAAYYLVAFYVFERVVNWATTLEE